MFRYETHLHTSPVSRCAKATVRESLEFYKTLGYDGVFITNHFIDGNINVDRSLPYRDRIEFFYSDAEEGERLADGIGMKSLTEGVETEEAAEFLKKAGCGRLQGYLFGKPMPLQQLQEMIDDGKFRVSERLI